MFELEHTRNLLYELGLNTASELLDAKLEDAMHKDATYLLECKITLQTAWPASQKRHPL